MASNAKKKTTMAKRNREAKLRERRVEKQAKRDARRRESAAPPSVDGTADAAATTPAPE
jgi:hypothetical protein